MKFDMHVKNIRNMKFNGYIFKIHTKKWVAWEVWRETLFILDYNIHDNKEK